MKVHVAITLHAEGEDQKWKGNGSIDLIDQIKDSPELTLWSEPACSKVGNRCQICPGWYCFMGQVSGPSNWSSVPLPFSSKIKSWLILWPSSCPGVSMPISAQQIFKLTLFAAFLIPWSFNAHWHKVKSSNRWLQPGKYSSIKRQVHFKSWTDLT